MTSRHVLNQSVHFIRISSVLTNVSFLSRDPIRDPTGHPVVSTLRPLWAVTAWKTLCFDVQAGLEFRGLSFRWRSVFSRPDNPHRTKLWGGWCSFHVLLSTKASPLRRTHSGHDSLETFDQPNRDTDLMRNRCRGSTPFLAQAPSTSPGVGLEGDLWKAPRDGADSQEDSGVRRLRLAPGQEGAPHTGAPRAHRDRRACARDPSAPLPVRLVTCCPRVLHRTLHNALVPATQSFPELVSCSSKSVEPEVGGRGGLRRATSRLQPGRDWHLKRGPSTGTFASAPYTARTSSREAGRRCRRWCPASGPASVLATSPAVPCGSVGPRPLEVSSGPSALHCFVCLQPRE